MPIEFGLVQIVSNKAKKPPKSNSSSSLSQIASSSQISSSQAAYTGLEICFICKQSVLKTSESVLNKSSALLKCLKCLGSFHTICLAENFLAETNQILPVDGDCPKCGTYLIWGELILFQKDNYKIRDCGSSGPEQDEDTDSEEFIEKDDDDDMNDLDDLDDL
jgi:Zn finger protein HypA/HybF involved in hydrogenase expression